MPPVGFEPTISAGERPQTYGLDRAAAGTGELRNLYWKEYFSWRVNTISEFVEESKKITRSFSQEDSVLLSKFKTDISLIKVRRVAEHRY